MTRKKNVNCSLFESLLAYFGHPQQQSLSYLGHSFTQAQILDEIYRVKNYLDSKGVKKGDIVSVMLPNIPAFVFSFYGISAAGAIVSLVPTYTSVLQLKNRLLKTKSKVIFIWDALYNDTKDILCELNIQVVVCSMKDYADERHYPYIEEKFNANINAPLKYTDLPCLRKTYDKGFVKLDGTEPAVHISTSGTTGGEPKLVTVSAHKIHTCLLRHYDNVLIKRFKVPDHGIALVDLQFACGFVFAFGMHLLLCHNRLIILPPELPRLKLTMLTENDVDFYFTHQNIISKTIEFNKDACKKAFSNLKFLNLNLISPPGTLRDEIKALLPGECIYADSYGLTELCCVIYQRYNDDMGYTIFGGNHLIKDINSNTVLPPYEKGELLINSRYIMDGYYNDEDITKNCYTIINRKKYLLTGDVGYLDETWQFYYVDRLKRMDKIGGYSVFPAEIETVIKTVPSIIDCVVARKVDADNKHYLAAYLQVNHSVAFDEVVDKTRHAILTQLNRFHVPMKFAVMDGIRHTPMGKNDYKYYESLND